MLHDNLFQNITFSPFYSILLHTSFFTSTLCKFDRIFCLPFYMITSPQKRICISLSGFLFILVLFAGNSTVWGIVSYYLFMWDIFCMDLKCFDCY